MTTRTQIDEIVVVIPANNEEALLGECLSALEVATRVVTQQKQHQRHQYGLLISQPNQQGASVPSIRIVLVLDDCTDGSAAIADQWPFVEVLTVQFRNVGRARAHGIAHALHHSAVANAECIWIANTDADSQVPPLWIARQLAIARSGIRLMIGSVRPDPRDLTAEQRDRWAARHPVNSEALRIYGANLGVRADDYLSAGGFPAITEHEDVVLVDRLQRAGVMGAVSHSCWVQTSARTVGRTPGGFAAHVRENY
ncbi:MAG: glycosyltransferase [Microbacteriaceae bacterium]|nr:glycosyltransferase [Microbacteriaceae bacterium]